MAQIAVLGWDSLWVLVPVTLRLELLPQPALYLSALFPQPLRPQPLRPRPLNLPAWPHDRLGKASLREARPSSVPRNCPEVRRDWIERVSASMVDAYVEMR
jgi:hypothetical protein